MRKCSPPQGQQLDNHSKNRKKRGQQDVSVGKATSCCQAGKT